MSDASPTDELVIELSKTKVVLMIVGSFAFVAAGAFFLLNAESIAKELPIDDPWFARGVGIASIVFFGLTGIMGAKKLSDKRPGLVLNSSGIIDNSSGVAAGFIPWSEIKDTEIYEMYRQKMLIIKVRNPETYIARGSALRRATIRINAKMSGSPIAITSNSLKINFDELLSTFERYQQKYGQSMKASVS
jgi:hypothetical protein